MKFLKTILVLLTTMAALAACGTKNNIPAIEANDGPTGYWYLSSSGERQWRTITPENIKPQAEPVKKNYPTAVGNGSGKG